jgi:hypothetical protein
MKPEDARQSSRWLHKNKMQMESEFTSCFLAGVKGVKGLPHAPRFIDGGESSTASTGPSSKTVQIINIHMLLIFFILYTVGRIRPSQGLYLHREQHKHRTKADNTDIHALIGFEPTIPASEREKSVHALDRAATVINPFNVIKTFNVSLNVIVYNTWNLIIEEYYLTGCDTVQYGRNVSSFRRTVLPPSSGSKSN